jgi:hypothetical protein
MREVIVRIGKDGTTTTDFSGFEGPSCLEEAERLRQLLATLGIESEVTIFQPKPELGAQAQSEQQRGRADAQQGGHA